MRSAHRLILFILACIIYASCRSPFIGQWDSFDYLKQIVTHRLSDLGFGRPVFIGFNIALWEGVKTLFHLGPLCVEGVVMAEIVLVGALGVVVFAGFARQLLSSTGGRLAALALLLSPMYAVYSGFVMTEVPMLVVLITAAAALWPSASRRGVLMDAAAGVLVGLAVGIREQALTLGGAYLWIIWVRRPDFPRRVRTGAVFAAAAAAVSVGPVMALYLHDPAAFAQRMQTWFRAIPTGQTYFWKNMQASLLWLLAVSPASWLAVLGAGVHRWLATHGRRQAGTVPAQPAEILGGECRTLVPAPAWGLFCCLILPIACLWRDADVQMHPRYAMVALPAAVILCTSLYARWATSSRAATAWVVVHLAVFGVAEAGIQPFREIQAQKRAYAQVVRDAVPGEALLIPGGYSPIMDYYRALGVRPRWQILWSGWGWKSRTAEARVRDAWSHRLPVYLCQGPAGWLYLEDELLDLHFVFKNSKRSTVAPGLFRIWPDY